MFAIYDKDELNNLTSDQEKTLRNAITDELHARKAHRSVKSEVKK